MESMLAFLFDLVWFWYVPALVEGLAVTLVLLILESLLARSRHVWTEIRTFLLYLVFLKLVVPPQLKLPTGVVSDLVGWVVSSLRSLPLQLAGASLSASAGLSGGPEVRWEYVHLEPAAALTWIWLPLLGWLLGFGFYMLSIRRTARQFRFTGNRILSDRDLLQLVATRAGNAYDRERLYDDLNDLMRTTLFGKVTGRLQVGKKGIIVRFEFEETRLRPEP